MDCLFACPEPKPDRAVILAAEDANSRLDSIKRILTATSEGCANLDYRKLEKPDYKSLASLFRPQRLCQEKSIAWLDFWSTCCS
ncbi:hypothetical protein RRG08_060833 [Elysia crispata]|uniref:Uncharacterized protein n=1 Tax=Elysia crispata TaxID=231223 RepID=A0AAE0ZGF7_9GAST|nr:hypothetical protein RRG08_060833 [Elysia crispata]